MTRRAQIIQAIRDNHEFTAVLLILADTDNAPLNEIDEYRIQAWLLGPVKGQALISDWMEKNDVSPEVLG